MPSDSPDLRLTWWGRFRVVAGIALTIAMLAGLTESAILLYCRYGLGVLTWTSNQIVWQAPLSYSVLFLALAPAVATVLPPPLPIRRIAIAAYASLAAAALVALLAYPALHPVAIALLGIGVGMSLARVDGRRGGAWWLRSGWRGLAPAIVVAALAVAGLQRWRDKAALSADPPARAAPNVVLILLDTVRAASMSLYGYERATTPALQDWAKKGVTFDSAMSTSSWTLPAHGTLFTGQWAHELDGDWTVPLGREWPTLAEQLAARGYATAGFVANFYYTHRESGLARGFSHYQDFRLTPKEVILASTAGQILKGIRDGEMPTERRHDPKRASQVTSEFLAWRASHDLQRPYFAFLNYFDAHPTYYAPPGIHQTFASDSWGRDRYDEAIRYLDQEVDRLLRDLDRLGDLDNTLVIITSDHGELFGEHGLHGHGNSMYWPLLHIPLVVLWQDKLPAGARATAPVSLRDLHDFILDAGDPRSSSAEGADLLFSLKANGPILGYLSTGRRSPQKHENSDGPVVSLVAGGYQYILQQSGCREQLYALAADPKQLSDLVGSTAARHRLEAMRDQTDDAFVIDGECVEARQARVEDSTPDQSRSNPARTSVQESSAGHLDLPR